MASRFNLPHNTSGVLCSRPGKYEFQVWTLQYEPVGIIKVTNSESREQAELAQHAVLKIRNTEQRKKLIQALQSQTVTHLQKTNLEVMYNRGMVHNLSTFSKSPLADLYAVFDHKWFSARYRKGRVLE